jgi:two-component system, sensor histidine kinase and response regulator
MKKILVIEDDIDIREVIQKILSFEGFCQITAENGLAGLQLARAEKPDLILCDVSMPELDGFEVLSKLRQDSSTAKIPFIFMTAKVDRNHLRQGMELGADDYITKPFTPVELLRAVAAQLQKQATLTEQNQQQFNQLHTSITLALPCALHPPLEQVVRLSKKLVENYQQPQSVKDLEMLKTIQTNSEMLYKLTQNFFLYAQLELAINDPEQLAIVRGHQVCEDVSIEIADVALQKAEQFDRTVDLQLDLQTAIVAIPVTDLRKIVEEVIDNAFKFSRSGTPVKVVGVQTDRQFQLAVIDRGQGIAPAQITNVTTYNPLATHPYSQQSLKLGLVVAKRLTELYAGELTIESVPKEQTTVRIYLPSCKT